MGCVLLCLTAAGANPTLAPGQWTRLDRDGVASIDGVDKTDVPIRPSTPSSTCLDAATSTRPAHWLLGEGGAACTIVHESYAGGRVAIQASCPPEIGDKPGVLTARGTWTADRVALAFTSFSYGDGRVFGYRGTIEARRTGVCAGS